MNHFPLLAGLDLHGCDGTHAYMHGDRGEGCGRGKKVFSNFDTAFCMMRNATADGRAASPLVMLEGVLGEEPGSHALHTMDFALRLQDQ